MQVLIDEVRQGQHLHQRRCGNLYLADSGDSLSEVLVRGITRGPIVEVVVLHVAFLSTYRLVDTCVFGPEFSALFDHERIRVNVDSCPSTLIQGHGIGVQSGVVAAYIKISTGIQILEDKLFDTVFTPVGKDCLGVFWECMSQSFCKATALAFGGCHSEAKFLNLASCYVTLRLSCVSLLYQPANVGNGKQQLLRKSPEHFVSKGV